ncbi:hypothetical protein [Nocardia arizonensis]|uniref:hypothetical protein n=1 Tax=Nocardia arizonensis TaxID=1141647 RepID=UPI000AA89935|nr:hypothetical protein [Nocardia arizonensis]
MSNATRAQDRYDYSWTIVHTDARGMRRLVESGRGRFGTADSFTNATFSSHTAVGAAIFDDACDYVTENHFCEMLDARIDDTPEPVAVVEVSVVVLDGDGAERATLTGVPYYRQVTDDDVAEHLIGMSQAAVEDERRRLARDLDDEPEVGAADFGWYTESHTYEAVAFGETLDEQRREPIDALRRTAAHLRAEVHEPDFCREQLARAEHDLLETDPTAERLTVDVRRARVDRWRRQLEISAEAYLDAAALDAAASNLRRAARADSDR